MKILTLLLLFTITLSAQIKGIVVDENDKPISYVNISVENENAGTTSEENGQFSIVVSKEKNLIFSALGFEKRIVKASETTKIILKETTVNLDEVIIAKRLETKKVEIGENKNSVFQAFDNGPRIDTKFFPYIVSYKKTKYIKKVTIETDSRIPDATIKLHFYSVDENGYPGTELLERDFTASVKQGITKSIFDLTAYNLRMPKKGIFVGFEKLIIEKNKSEKKVTDQNTNTTQVKTTYWPFVLYNLVERDFQYILSGGKWSRKTGKEKGTSAAKIMVYEPAINLILTN